MRFDSERFEREREIARTLDPRRRITYSNFEWFVRQAAHRCVRVLPTSMESACADRGERTIFIPPVEDDASLAVGMHEIGHIVDDVVDRADGPSTMQSEERAWAWAVAAIAHRWTPAMTNTLTSCLATYQRSHVYTHDHLLQMERTIALARQAERRVVWFSR